MAKQCTACKQPAEELKIVRNPATRVESHVCEACYEGAPSDFRTGETAPEPAGDPTAVTIGEPVAGENVTVTHQHDTMTVTHQKDTMEAVGGQPPPPSSVWPPDPDPDEHRGRRRRGG